MGETCNLQEQRHTLHEDDGTLNDTFQLYIRTTDDYALSLLASCYLFSLEEPRGAKSD